jgi:hypothetical protein
MSHVMIRQRVKDFDTWKRVFESGREFRRASGELSSRVFRVGSDRKDLVLWLDFESEERARQFLESSELRAKRAEAGALGDPEVLFLNPLS